MPLLNLLGDLIPKLLFLGVMTPVAIGATSNANNPTKTSEVSGSPSARIALTDTLSLGSHFEMELTSERNFDLKDDEADELTLFQPTLSVALAWRPTNGINAYTNLELHQQLELTAEAEKKDRLLKLEIDKLYLDFTQLINDCQVRIGRQRFKNEREWVADDTLDGLRLKCTHSKDSRFEAALMREQGFTSDLLNSDEPKKVDYLLLRFQSKLNETINYAFYVLDQRDHERDESVWWYGLYTQGELIKDLEYWGHFALVHGDKRGEAFQGHGFDVGGSYRLLKSPRIYTFVDYAFGAGDSNQNPDLRFRQTGLQDNAAKMGGVTRYGYYGEVFDPELSNLSIVTTGIGVRFTRNSSLDLIWHRYQQDVAIDEIRDTAINDDPRGKERDLGQEIDLVFGYRMHGRFKFKAVIGRFEPGDAFKSNRTAAELVNLSFKYGF